MIEKAIDILKVKISMLELKILKFSYFWFDWYFTSFGIAIISNTIAQEVINTAKIAKDI